MPPVATQHQTSATELGSRRMGPTAEAVVVADVVGWQWLRLAIQTSSPTQVHESGASAPKRMGVHWAASTTFGTGLGSVT